MSRPLEVYTDNLIMNCFVTRDFTAMNHEFEDSELDTLGDGVFAYCSDLLAIRLPKVTTPFRHGKRRIIKQASA